MDDPRKTAFNGAAPGDERFDASSELQQTYMPLASALIPSEDIRQVIEYVEEQSLMMKARGAQIISLDDHRKDKKTGGIQSVYIDDLQIYSQGEYWEKPSPLGFDSLRMMVDQTPVLNAVLLTRIRQLSAFTSPRETERGTGFEIRHIDKDHVLQKDEKESIKLLTRFFNNCGWEFDPRRRNRLKRDNLSGFVAKYVRDSLTMDSAAIETVMKRDKNQGIDGFYCVDGATIRLCNEQGYDGDDEIFALQVVQGVVRTAYGYEDLIYQPRNPRTDVRLAGYGLGEPELLIRVVTGFLNAMTHNIKGLDENAIPKGLLHLSGGYSTEDLAAFKRYWNTMVKGANNAWTLPVMVSKDQESKASFERFGVDFNEMYFSKWMTFLVSLICAIYGIGPDEINFESFTSQSGGMGMGKGNDTEEKIINSKDKGLKPLMKHMETILSDYIASSFADKYVFRWAGLDPEDEEKRHEMRKSVLTVNEVRAQEGYPKTSAAWGDAPLNPSLVGAWMQEAQAKEPQDFGQPEGGTQDGENPGEAGGEQLGEDDNHAGQKPGDDFGKPGADSNKKPGTDFGKSFPVFPTIYTIN